MVRPYHLNEPCEPHNVPKKTLCSDVRLHRQVTFDKVVSAHRRDVAALMLSSNKGQGVFFFFHLAFFWGEMGDCVFV